MTFSRGLDGRTAKAVVWLTALAIATAVTAQPLELAFESNPARGAILLRGTVNGKPAHFLLDTGAARTIVSAEIMGIAPMDLKLAKFSTDGPGLHGEALWSAATLRLGERTWRDRSTVVMNLQPLSTIYGRRIDGIVGQDVLREFSRITIDFKRKRLILEG